MTGHPHRSYQIGSRHEGDPYLEWVTPPPAGAPERGYPALGDAPGTYVFST